MKSKVLGLLAVGLLATGIANAAIVPGSTVYATADATKVREGTGFGGPAIAELPMGTPVTVVEISSSRAKVRLASGQEGWVTLRQIQEKPPSKSGGGLGGLVKEDRSAGELGTAASGRGLAEAAVEMAKMTNIDPSVVAAVQQYEALGSSITDPEVDAFMREGGLNP